MSSYLEGLPSIVGNLGSPVTILNEFVLEAKEIDGGTRLVITSLSSGEVQTVDIMNAHTPEKGVDYWTESDKQEIVQAAAAAIPLDDTLSHTGKAADAGAVGTALDDFEKRMERLSPEPTRANQILATDESGNVHWQDKTHYSTFSQETVFEEYTVADQSGAWIRDQSLLADVVAGAEYTVTYNGTDYTLIAYNDANFGPSLGNVSILSSGEDTGEPFYLGNLSRAIPQILAYFTTNGPHVFSIKGTSEKVKPLPGKYVGGGVYPGKGLYATTIGTESAYASGQASVALNSAIAQGDNALAEGFGHAEGDYSHAEGSWTYATGHYSHAEGLHTRAESSSQHVQGKYNVADEQEKYAHIVGNGKGSNSRSNAHTVDWAGNAWFAGKIYSGGTGQDDGAAAEVALKTDIPDAIVTPESATVGQSIVVKAVDEAGKPTSWAAETVVKRINGKAPDDTGNVESFHSVSFNFIDGSAVVPGLIQYYGKETMAEIYAYYQEAAVYNVECCRFIMGQGNTVQQRWCIATETIKDNGVVTRLRLYFGDDIAPVIMDIVNNKLYFDPDWTKPADLPNPDAGNHMLVTDAEGQTSWAERTHYVEMIPDVVLPEITVTAKSAFLKNYGAYTRNLEKEHTYHIVCDGVEYSCVPAWNESLYGYTIGNAALASAGEDTGEPFFINSHMNTDMTIIYFAKDGTHTVSIDEGFIEHVHPLDMKYMPAGVVKSVSGIVPDANGNIRLNRNIPISIIDGTSMVPGLFTMNTACTIKEAINYLRVKGDYDAYVYRIIMNADNTSTIMMYTGYELIDLGSGVYNARVLFGDDICPVIFDAVNNKIIADPDWVAPKEPPIPTASHQMLVTDDDGNAAWEDRTHWSEYQQMALVDETLMKQELFPGMYIYQTQYLPKYPIEIGAKCLVELNGTTYESTIQEYGEGGPPCLGNRYLQNQSAFEDTGEPFFFNTLLPGSIVMAVFASNFTVPDTVSVSGPVRNYVQIPSEYIAGIKEGTAMGAIVLSGDSNTATGVAACAEGAYTDAKGYAAHSEGMATVAEASYSHAEGQHTVAKSTTQHVQGRYNIEDTAGKYAHIVGNGNSAYGETTYSNAHTLDWQGNAWFSGDVYVGGSGQDDSNNVKRLVTRDEVLALIEEKLSSLANGST